MAIAVGTAPARYSGMPRHNGAMSLHNGGKFPHNGAMSPHNGGMSSHNGGMAPHNGGMSPHNGGMSSHNGGMPPHNGGMSLHNGGMPLHNAEMSRGYVNHRVRHEGIRARLRSSAVRAVLSHPRPRWEGSAVAAGTHHDAKTARSNTRSGFFFASSFAASRHRGSPPIPAPRPR
jgi:hypothetical protein